VVFRFQRGVPSCQALDLCSLVRDLDLERVELPKGEFSPGLLLHGQVEAQGSSCLEAFGAQLTGGAKRSKVMQVQHELLTLLPCHGLEVLNHFLDLTREELKTVGKLDPHGRIHAAHFCWPEGGVGVIFGKSESGSVMKQCRLLLHHGPSEKNIFASLLPLPRREMTEDNPNGIKGLAWLAIQSGEDLHWPEWAGPVKGAFHQVALETGGAAVAMKRESRGGGSRRRDGKGSLGGLRKQQLASDSLRWTFRGHVNSAQPGWKKMLEAAEVCGNPLCRRIGSQIRPGDEPKLRSHHSGLVLRIVHDQTGKRAQEAGDSFAGTTRGGRVLVHVSLNETKCPIVNQERNTWYEGVGELVLLVVWVGILLGCVDRFDLADQFFCYGGGVSNHKSNGSQKILGVAVEIFALPVGTLQVGPFVDLFKVGGDRDLRMTQHARRKQSHNGC